MRIAFIIFLAASLSLVSCRECLKCRYQGVDPYSGRLVEDEYTEACNEPTQVLTQDDCEREASSLEEGICECVKE